MACSISKSEPKRLLFAVLFAVSVTAAGQSHATEPSNTEAAAVLFREGRDAMKRGDYSSAYEQLLKSSELDRQLGTLLNLALCEERLGRLRSASEHLAEVARLAAAGDVRGRFAEARRGAIDDRLPRIALNVDAEPGAAITLDGVRLAAESWSSPLALDPGEHELSASAPGRRPVQMKIRLEESQRLHVFVKLDRVEVRAQETRAATHTATAPIASPGAPPLPPAARVVSTRRSSHRDGALVAASLGATGLLVSSIAAMFVLRDKSLVDEHCKAGPCDARGAEAQSQGRTWSVIGTVSFAVGVAGLGAGTYLWLSSSAPDPSGKERAMAGVGGRF
jgi:hypothetical protein